MDSFQPQLIDDRYQWLAANYATTREMWLVYTRSTSKENPVQFEETVGVAICFGWIDGLIKRLDNKEYARKFTPRKSGIKWLRLTSTARNGCSNR